METVIYMMLCIIFGLCGFTVGYVAGQDDWRLKP